MNPARHAGPGQGKALLDGRSDRWGPSLASQQRAGRPIDTQRYQKGYSFASLTPSLWQFWLAKFSPDLVQGESTRGHIWSRERLPMGIFGPGSVYPRPYLVQGASTRGQIWSRESTRGHIWSRERLPMGLFGPGSVYPRPYLVQGASTRGQIWSRESLPVAIFGPGGELLPLVRCGPGRVYPWPYLVQGASTSGQIWSRESQLVAIFGPGGERLPLVRSDPGRVPVARFDPERAYPAHISSRESLPAVRFYTYHCRQETDKRRERSFQSDGGSCQHRVRRTHDERARLNSAQGNTATTLTTTLSSSLRFHGHTPCLSATLPHLVRGMHAKVAAHSTTTCST